MQNLYLLESADGSMTITSFRAACFLSAVQQMSKDASNTHIVREVAIVMSLATASSLGSQ